MDKIEPVAQGVALTATGLFAGAAVFVSLVEVPAAFSTGTSHFYAYFPNMLIRAAKLQGGLAFLGSHAAMVAAARAASGADKNSWRTAGLLLGAVWPWTVFVMTPINKRIVKQDAKDEAEQRTLLEKWDKLHWVRTGLSLCSFGVIAATLINSRHG